ncbi:MAG: SIR2 family protein [Variibacter sp.]
MTAPITLPDALLQAVTAQRTVLFLGAGASMEATDSAGKHPPNSAQLRALIGQHFLGKPMDGYDLMSVSEIAIQAHGQPLVFEFIKRTLEPFEPSPAHKLMPSFRWRAIATTNYDLLANTAYGRDRKRLQTLVPFVKDSEPVEERLQQADHPLPFLKLHGCLSHVHDDAIPLVLSHEHYSRHSRHRTRLFHRLQGLAYESTFIFCGYGLGDAHIRNIIYDLAENGVKRPAWYLVAPGVAPHDASFWATRNVHLIDATFGQFMAALDATIPPARRVLAGAQPKVADPLVRHFSSSESVPDRVATALAQDLTHVHPEMPLAPQEPRRFYEGFDTGWGGIAQRLDVPRKPVEDLIIDAVLDPPSTPEPQLFVFTGPAGAGKTIALKRAAWEAAADYGALALWLNDNAALASDVVAELHRLSGKRIYLFVDRLALHVEAVEALLVSAKGKSLPVTVVAAERNSEWNTYCVRLQKQKIATELAIPNLNEAEIHGLIDLLTRHGALGFLAGKSRDEQVRAFSERAERQLLVALHEATLGKPFEAIVFDEYKAVVPDQARQLYLDICTMHQFGVSVRAGTIARISGIRFTDFQTDFLSPLERIVLTQREGGDIHYRARHSRIAQLVFQQACPNDQRRAEQLVRLIAALDIGYSIDKKALEQMTRGRQLTQTLNHPEPGREIYRAALLAAPDASWLLHQWANFELNHPRGDIEEADRIAREASTRDPRSKAIKHTQAEIARRRANEAATSMQKEQFRRLARERLDEARADADSYILSARCKLAVDEVGDLASVLIDPPADPQLIQFRDKVRDAEGLLARARQLHPDDADINQVEARLRGLLAQHAQAIRALERAWKANPPGSGVAIRLADHYSQSDPKRGIEMLQSALDRNQDDRAAHLAMAKHLLAVEPLRTDTIQQHLARSYRVNDNNHEARSLHAQVMFMTGKTGDAWSLFQLLDASAPPDFRQRASESIVSEKLPRYQGTIATMKATVAFISCPAYPADIFAHARNTKPETWRALRPGDAVSLAIRFSRSGPAAFDIEFANQ